MSLSQELGQLTGHMTKRARYNSRHIPQAGGSGDQPLTAKPQPLSRHQSRDILLESLGESMARKRKRLGLGPRTEPKPSGKPPTMSKEFPSSEPDKFPGFKPGSPK